MQSIYPRGRIEGNSLTPEAEFVSVWTLEGIFGTVKVQDYSYRQDCQTGQVVEIYAPDAPRGKWSKRTHP
jgi:hypothetical protein